MPNGTKTHRKAARNEQSTTPIHPIKKVLHYMFPNQVNCVTGCPQRTGWRNKKKVRTSTGKRRSKLDKLYKHALTAKTD